MTSFESLLSQARYFLLRYETEHVPCTGITAVTRQERRAFRDGLMIAPWHERLVEAQQALTTKTVVPAGKSFAVATPEGDIPVTILIGRDPPLLPVVYVAASSCFQGIKTPYDTPHLNRDTLVFGLAVERLLATIPHRTQWVSGADWECVPALCRVRRWFPTLLILHNDYDAYLASAARVFPDYVEFCQGRTALQIGMQIADVTGAVNQGFATGLAQDSFHRLVLAAHLQDLVPRVVGIDNAAFTLPDAAQIDLVQQDLPAARRQLHQLKAEARSKLPPELQPRFEGRTIVLCFGRRSTQKQHDVTVEAARNYLSRRDAVPVLFVFTTTDGDPGAAERLARIQGLAAEHSDSVLCLDGRCRFFKHLQRAADFNVMSSLWEPHGAAFEGLAVPIARAVDGLLAQICALEPIGRAAALNDEWHAGEPPAGFLFREDPLDDPLEQARQLGELLNVSPSPDNELFQRMVAALTQTLHQALALKARDEPAYVRLVQQAQRQQMSWTWNENFAMQLALMRQASTRRNLSSAPF